MTYRKLPIITRKIVLVSLITGLILCSVVFFAGYWSFSKHFENQYDKDVRSVAAVVRDFLQSDSISAYIAHIDSVKDSPKKSLDSALLAQYERNRRTLQYFVDNFNLNLLYVSVVKGPEYKDITYIYNPVSKNGKWKEFPLGYRETYVEPNYNKSAKKIFEEGEPIVRHTLKSRSGSHITSMLPLKNAGGKVIAVIGIQKDIQEYVSARHRFANFVVVVETIFALLALLIFSSFFNRKFINPILLVTEEAAKFTKNGGKPSDKLLSVNNRDELQTLAHSVHQMESDVHKYINKLTTVTAEKERIETELGVATRIQNAMLPKTFFPERTDFELFACMSAAKEVGGDLYDYILLDDQHLLFVVGDVSGKGIPAALFMVVVKTLFHSYAEQGLSPSEIFETTNKIIVKGNTLGYFITSWLGILDLATGEIRFVNAGHCHPAVCRNGKYEFLKTKANFVLGGMDSIAYQEHSIKLEPGDQLFLYTDGVTEANQNGGELFGEARLLEALNSCCGAVPEETCKNVRKHIDKFVQNVAQFDDITMLAVKFNGKQQKNLGEHHEKTMEAKPENQAAFSSFVEDILNKYQCPAKTKTQILVALDEIYSNITKFSGANQVTMDLAIREDTFTATLTFIDNGTPYDPLQNDDPDINLSIDERGIGGLGIYIVKKTMDKVSYNRKNNCNVFSIEKKLNG